MDFFFFCMVHKLERNRGKFGRSAWRIKGGDQRDDNDPKLVEYLKKNVRRIKCWKILEIRM